MKRMRMRTHCKCGHHMREHVKPGLSGIIHPGSGPCIRCSCEKFFSVPRVGTVSKYSTGTPPPDYAPSPDPEPLRW